EIWYTDAYIRMKSAEVIFVFELECLTNSASDTAASESCVPDCPCQPDQRENECFPYFVDEPENGDAPAE
ncbi:MAG: hypothetical protein J5722_01600, partial [Oscillospiraceae bacterium]|nr:hypothetical protein [Oscillospiraceae bacterium]